MGSVDGLLGGAPEESANEPETGTDDRFAVLLNAGPDDAATAANAFNYALESDDAGCEVRSPSTAWRPRVPRRSRRTPTGRSITTGSARRSGGSAPAPGGLREPLRRRGRLRAGLSDGGEHAPAVARLAGQGYELPTVG